MANKIQMRRGTLASWTSANPTLLEGEIGYVTDKAYIVIGDGATAFTGLTPWSPTGNVISLSTGSPYTISSAAGLAIFLINASTNPYVINLPASVGGGAEIKIVDASLLNTGLVKVVPHSGDAIGNLAANAPVYLQNLDQSGMSGVFQSIDLIDAVAGKWSVAGGQWQGSQAVDPVGSQYVLGKLRHLPLGNTTDRSLGGGGLTVAAQGSWYASAILAAGVGGVPSGAKGIRAKVVITPYATGAGRVALRMAFSDNNSNTPNNVTSHPLAAIVDSASGAGLLTGGLPSEIDIPLNASGQFYMYTILMTNITAASSTFTIVPVGYYMGD